MDHVITIGRVVRAPASVAVDSAQTKDFESGRLLFTASLLDGQH